MEPDEYQPPVINIPLPIAHGRVNSVIALTADWPLTEDEWNHMMTVLEAMRPGLTFVPGPH